MMNSPLRGFRLRLPRRHLGSSVSLADAKKQESVTRRASKAVAPLRIELPPNGFRCKPGHRKLREPPAPRYGLGEERTDNVGAKSFSNCHTSSFAPSQTKDVVCAIFREVRSYPMHWSKEVFDCTEDVQNLSVLTPPVRLKEKSNNSSLIEFIRSTFEGALHRRGLALPVHPQVALPVHQPPGVLCTAETPSTQALLDHLVSWSVRLRHAVAQYPYKGLSAGNRGTWALRRRTS